MANVSTPFLPDYQFSELHESKPMPFPAESILHAVDNFDIRSDWFANIFLTLRELPLSVRKCYSGEPVSKTEAFGLHKFTLLNRSANELSLGLLGKFWRPDMGLVPIPDAESFVSCRDDSVAKLVLRFKVIEMPNKMRSLRTETFVYCPSRKVKLLFLPYWIIIRIVSGWIRQRTLMLIRQQLEKEVGSSLPPQS
jgi:hypothetical protein